MKPAQKELVRERAREAIRDLYHNATPSYPRLDDEAAERFQVWFNDAAEFEIDYLQSGGAYGSNYRKTLAAPCNAGKYKSEKARAYYIAAGMRKMRDERADCGMLSGWRVLELAAGNVNLARTLAGFEKTGALTRNDARWEEITDYGKLYTYGRGGRTLAPADLITGNRSPNPREDYCDEMSIPATIELIRIVESFNRFVAAWCKGVPAMWAEHEREY